MKHQTDLLYNVTIDVRNNATEPKRPESTNTEKDELHKNCA